MKASTSLLLSLPCFAAAAAVQQAKVSYDGYKVFRVAVGDEVAKVNGIVEKLGLTTWKGAPRANAMADIVVPPAQLEAFNAEIGDMQSITMHEDLGASIAEESNFGVYAAAASVNSTWFSSYHAYSDHLQFLKDLAAQYSGNAEVVTSGKSLQGNSITGIHIYGSSGKGVKPAIVLHGTVHAREWIGTMVVEYFAYTLLSNYSSSTEIKGFVDKHDFYIFPVVNPDGFLYTQSNDRLWRKNRQSTSGSTCLGHDINRNWPYMWSVPGGASTDPCAQDFKGSAQGDAPETAALSSYLKSLKAAQGLKLFIDYHSYSQLFMTPYGYSCTAVASKNTELQALAKGAVAAIKAVHGVTFDYGPICSTIYQATGSSVDYVNDVVGSDYTFTSELRDTGNYGFLLPANQIVPSGEEAFAGFRYLLLNMK
ncbi:zinc carboxypeptidase [Thozetella sp. PMI_491]|nr:zinc carboxypeptidase [Thozetella sp. PMI_491]